MAITNQTKISSSLANSSKPDTGVTWASILTTWASETKTWLVVSQLLTNSTKQTSSITNTARP